MKKLILLTIALLVLAVFTIQAADPVPAKSTGSKVIESLSQGKIQLSIPKVGTDVKRLVLDNGLVLYLYEDHRLSLFNASAMIFLSVVTLCRSKMCFIANATARAVSLEPFQATSTRSPSDLGEAGGAISTGRPL